MFVFDHMNIWVAQRPQSIEGALSRRPNPHQKELQGGGIAGGCKGGDIGEISAPAGWVCWWTGWDSVAPVYGW